MTARKEREREEGIVVIKNDCKLISSRVMSGDVVPSFNHRIESRSSRLVINDRESNLD